MTKAQDNVKNYIDNDYIVEKCKEKLETGLDN
jgi:hypothetical protein